MQKLNTMFKLQTKKYRLEMSPWYRLVLLFSIAIQTKWSTRNSIIKLGSQSRRNEITDTRTTYLLKRSYLVLNEEQKRVNKKEKETENN